MTPLAQPYTVVVPGSHLMGALVGPRDAHLRLIEQAFPEVTVVARGNEIHVVGNDAEGRLKQRSFIKKLQGGKVGGRKLNAIQLTTAAGVVGAVELFARGRLGRGFVRQESIALKDFLSTRWGGRVYGL